MDGICISLLLAVVWSLASCSPAPDGTGLSRVLLPSADDPPSLYRPARSDGGYPLTRYGSRYEESSPCARCSQMNERASYQEESYLSRSDYRRPEVHESGWRDVHRDRDRGRPFASSDKDSDRYGDRYEDDGRDRNRRPAYDDRENTATAYDKDKKENSTDDRYDDSKTARPVSKFDIPKDDHRYSDRDENKNDFYGGRPAHRPSYDRDRDPYRDEDDDRRRPSSADRRPSYDDRYSGGRKPYFDEDGYADRNVYGSGERDRGYADRNRYGSGDRGYADSNAYGGGDRDRGYAASNGYGNGNRGYEDRRYPDGDYTYRDSSYRGNGYDDRGYDNRSDRHGSFRPWDETYRGTSGFDDGGRGYYFATGRPSPDSGYNTYRPSSYGGSDYQYGRRPASDRDYQYGSGGSGYPRDWDQRGGGGDYPRGGTSSSGWHNIGDRREPQGQRAGGGYRDQRRPESDDYFYRYGGSASWGGHPDTGRWNQISSSGGWRDVGGRGGSRYGTRDDNGYRGQSPSGGGRLGGWGDGGDERNPTAATQSTSYLHERTDADTPVTEAADAKNATITTTNTTNTTKTA